MKYPIGIQTFSEIRQRGYSYVDKTGFIPLLLRNKYYFLSRPRRFGKSLLLSTLEAYFQGRRELFDGLAIAETEAEWSEHPVIHLDFAAMMGTDFNTFVDNLQVGLIEVGKSYDIEIPQDRRSPNLAFSYLIKTLSEKYGKGTVVLIDEYDKGIIETLQDEKMMEAMIDMLRPFFSVLKSQDRYIRFAFLTGVSRFHNTTIFSGSNNLKDISMEPRFAALCGITQNELEANFQEGISELAAELGYTPEKILETLKNKYDGYRFTRKDIYLYNPFSLLCAMDSCQIDDYWVMSGSSKILATYLRKSRFDLNELTDRWVTGANLAATYNTSDPLSLFFQTGYLTIREYDGMNAYRLGIPNEEVQAALANLLIPEFVNNGEEKDINDLQIKLHHALRDGDVDTMMDLLRSLVASVPYHEIDIKVLERHIHLCMYIIFMMLGTSARCEIAHSAGRVDLVAQTPWRIYIFEFKIDGTPEEAMRQIEDKGYAIPWMSRGRKVTKVGVNFSSKLRTIESWLYTTM